MTTTLIESARSREAEIDRQLEHLKSERGRLRRWIMDAEWVLGEKRSGSVRDRIDAALSSGRFTYQQLAERVGTSVPNLRTYFCAHGDQFGWKAVGKVGRFSVFTKAKPAP